MSKKKRKRAVPVEVPSAVEAPPVRVPAWLWTVPLALAFLFNLPVLNNGFVWDDYNIFEYQIPNLTGIGDMFFPARKIAELGTHYFRPLVLLSYKIDTTLWGVNARGLHLTVLLSHALNTLLVYVLALMVCAKNKTRVSIALMSSALFAVYPVHAEVVGWICGRNDSLATSFALLSLVSYALFRRGEKIVWLFGSCAFFLMGLFCKEVAASVLLIVPLYDLCSSNGKGSSRRGGSFGIYALFAAVFAVYFLLRHASLGGSGMTALKGELNPVAALLGSVGYYVQVTLAPVRLNYFIFDIPSSGLFMGCSVLAIVAFLGVALRCYFTGRRGVTFAIFTFVFALLPSLAIAVTTISETPLALRYLYFPSVGFTLLLGCLLGVDWEAGKSPGNLARMAVFLVLFVFYQQVNARQIRVWKDDLSLWTNVTRMSPQYGFGYGHLARQYALEGRYEDAIRNARKALEGKYDNEGRGIVANMLGYVYLQMNELDEAEQWYKRSIEYRPKDYALPYYNLGFLYVSQYEKAVTKTDPRGVGDKKQLLEQAIAYLNRSIEIHPHYYKARYYRGVCYFNLGRRDLSREELLKLIEMDDGGTWAGHARDILKRIDQNE